jgi:hypothetical protein
MLEDIIVVSIFKIVDRIIQAQIRAGGSPQG